MIDAKMLNALNVQVKEELQSAYIYLAMASDFESKNLKGFTNWMKVQAREEMVHVMKIYDFINSRGGKVVFQGLDAPKEAWDSPLDAFKAAYEHEQFITGCINKLVKLAKDLNDSATEIFLQWFVTEQVEEEESASNVVHQLEFVGDSGTGLFMLDAELGKRVFVAPPQEAAE